MLEVTRGVIFARRYQCIVCESFSIPTVCDLWCTRVCTLVLLILILLRSKTRKQFHYCDHLHVCAKRASNVITTS